MEAIYFPSATEFERWMEAQHESAKELLVGYHKVGTGRPSMTWAESVDVALCFGWIDGVRRRVDDERYTIRFTPRKPKSNWSAVNLRRVEQLRTEGRMRPSGLAAYDRRGEDQGKHYSFENRPEDFSEPHRRRFEKEETAWGFFQRQPNSYRTAAIWWVISAKRPETQVKRLGELIECSSRAVRLPQFTWTRK